MTIIMCWILSGILSDFFIYIILRQVHCFTDLCKTLGRCVKGELGFFHVLFSGVGSRDSGLCKCLGCKIYEEEGRQKADVVTIPAEVKHWHGAKKDSWFSHLAVEVPGEECSNEWCGTGERWTVRKSWKIKRRVQSFSPALISAAIGPPFSTVIGQCMGSKKTFPRQSDISG